MSEYRRILVVDDEPFAREMIGALLANEGYELHFAENGLDGLKCAIELQPDVLLLDVMMPRLNGFEVCRIVRSTPILAEMPVLFITAMDDHASRLEGLRAGADDFLTKPLDGLELITRLQSITRLNRYRRLLEGRREVERLNSELLRAYDRTIEGWSRALDLRDKETEGHSQRVTEMTLRLATAADVSGENLLHIRRGALLHDVGKLGIPDAILLKSDKLSADEWAIMRMHPVYAYEWLSPIDYLRPALDIPYCHHERWDGSGYPRGLSGTQIPLAARLFAVADVWDALRSDRPYRAGWEAARVVAHIRTAAGSHFDPAAVMHFLSIHHI
jgi:putative two-component system response regulator